MLIHCGSFYVFSIFISFHAGGLGGGQNAGLGGGLGEGFSGGLGGGIGGGGLGGGTRILRISIKISRDLGMSEKA